jgi:dUTPase
MKIPIFCKVDLVKTLVANSIKLCDYKPAYGGESAALDLYNVSTSDFIIPPASRDTAQESTLHFTDGRRLKTLIPTGLHIAVPQGHVALLRERGSVTKTPLVLRAGVIDPGYTGEVFVNMVNISDIAFTIKAHEKLPVQLLVTQALTDFQLMSTWEDYEQQTASAKRARGKIGSSD